MTRFGLRPKGPRPRPLAAIAAWLVMAAVAHAEPGSAPAGLAAAEKAFQNVDFKKAQDLATRAIEIGGAERDETARLYVLAGTTAAALGMEEESRLAFIVALAVDPTIKLEQTLSPKMRAPYLEALGYWGSYRERLQLEAKVTTDRDRVSVRLVDQAHLVSKVALHLRVVGSDHDESFTQDAKASVSFAVPRDARGSGFDYYVQALDEHRNVLAELGSDADLREARVHAAPVAATAASERDAPPRAKQSYALPAVLGVTGLAVVGVGVAFHVQRETAAKEWNGPSCERPGATRIDQCGNVDSRLRLDEAVAIGAYVAGGALLTGSVITWLVGRNSSEAGPEPVRAGFRGCAVGVSAVVCDGRF